MEIVWEFIDIDDLQAKVGNYTLRVEQMSRRKWWWAVSFRNERITQDDMAEEWASSMKQAQALAEKYMKKHMEERNGMA